MIKLRDYLLYLFNTPSAFYDSPKQYVMNVVGHTILIGLAMHFFGFVVGGLIYAAWELAQWKLRNASPADCWEDWAFVMCGSASWATQDWKFAVIATAFLVAGTLWRREQLKQETPK
jgi:hypothetical protein